MSISASTARRLLKNQYPEWAGLSLKTPRPQGVGNVVFQLGDTMALRFPLSKISEDSLLREIKWLPYLKDNLTLKVPHFLAQGYPDENYPYNWGIYQWIKGVPVFGNHVSKEKLALDLASALQQLLSIPVPKHAPKAGKMTFHRGSHLSVYTDQVHKALSLLKGQYDTEQVLSLWEDALSTTWDKPAVWVHGDISSGNLIVTEEGRLKGLIDFEQMCVGDPACDYTMAWTFFDNAARETFRSAMDLTNDTWSRARGWALWKALIVKSKLVTSNAVEESQSTHTLNAILSDSHI